MDDTELYREQILRHATPVITGRFVGFGASYTRAIKVGQPLVLAVFVAATVARLIGALIRLKGVHRSLKDLKTGPEFLVTPVRLRDDLGQVYEVEMHGHLAASALHRGDLVQLRTQAQDDPTLPVRLMTLLNLTTMQPLTPRIPTMWSHIGPALLIQAALGVTLAVVAIAAWIS
ncbi:hypothetical protein [Actinoplanes sp. NPDC089786]|uniref:hypothetical protein n=1 Tax=Actinoplanes sp. NPDC089786 TaxID=3155185 RepID=UPI0034342553